MSIRDHSERGRGRRRGKGEVEGEKEGRGRGEMIRIQLVELRRRLAVEDFLRGVWLIWKGPCPRLRTK